MLARPEEKICAVQWLWKGRSFWNFKWHLFGWQWSIPGVWKMLKIYEDFLIIVCKKMFCHLILMRELGQGNYDSFHHFVNLQLTAHIFWQISLIYYSLTWQYTNICEECYLHSTDDLFVASFKLHKIFTFHWFCFLTNGINIFIFYFLL